MVCSAYNLCIDAWFSIEVSSDHGSARHWVETHVDSLVKGALNEGAIDWHVEHRPWGSVIELEFLDEADFEHFRDHPEVQAALDSAPGRVHVRRGRGGASGTMAPRRPRPFAGAGAVALPVPDEDDDLLAAIARAELTVFAGAAT